MTLTEEQRAALKRVVAYMDDMYAIASPYHGCTEDANILRAMIDSGDHFGEPNKMMGFDLERIKADLGDIGDPRFCDCEVRTQLAAAIAEIARLRADLEQAERVIEARSEVIDQQAARIRGLEDALVEERARGNHYGMSYEDAVGDGEFERWIIDGEKDLPKIYLDRVRVEAKRQLRAEGKIGPDAKPRSWQITEERKAAIWHAVAVLKENDPDDEHLWDEEIAVLRAMLTEAE